MAFTLRSYRGDDEAALLSLWNATMTHDGIHAATFRTRVLLDANFVPEGLLIAEDAGGLRGFVLALTRQVPLFLQGLEPETGWITAFGVHPEVRRRGIGRALFDAALARMRALGRTRVLISPYTPNYFIPGVDVGAYPDALAFLGATGWTVAAEPISMRADLTGWRMPREILDLEAQRAREGVVIRPVESADLPELMPFIVQHFGWDWFRFAQEYLLELFGAGSDEIGFLVARQGARIVGYCQHKRERFGPFGVAEEARHRGIGRLLLFRALATMRLQGFHCAWFLWTGKAAARLYALAGFEPVRQFVVLKKEVDRL